MKNGFIIIQWLFGILFLLAGIGNILSFEILAGLFFFVAGLLLVPPIRAALAQRFTFLRSKIIRIAVFAGCVISAGIFTESPPRDGDTDSQNGTPLLSENQTPREVDPEVAAARKQANLKRTEDRKREAAERKRLVQEKKAKEDQAKINQLLTELKKIPAALTHANLSRYQQLMELNPANEDFKAKFQIYADRLSDPLKVIGIKSAEAVILLTADKKQLKTYLYGVDAPELGQEFSSKSKAPPF